MDNIFEPPECPFKIGQLVIDKYFPDAGIMLVLEMTWKVAYLEWELRLLSQQTGRIYYLNPVDLQAAEEYDE